ncbi:hypothetical protein QBC38DRAFT_373533 [Podospora fimiseda]|uniref:Uncharacterized protein n=1 Tax=Podospora fimiseda TaxID=252190 RepID=A0AAN7BH94_9PEZI|nr:hypothetical protein QBC38DRAFT_373533 [Podospora fimiseda]
MPPKYTRATVHFESPSGAPEVFVRRTRSVNRPAQRRPGSRQQSRGASVERTRTRSAERRHSIFDESPIDMQGRSRENYDALLRENHILKLQLRDQEEDLRAHRTWAEQLSRDNTELRRSLESNSDSEAKRSSKLREARKTIVKLESENSTLSAQVRDLGRKLKEAIESKTRVAVAEVENLKAEIQVWRRRHEDVTRRYDRMRGNVDGYVEENAQLKQENEELRRENRELTERVAIRRRHGGL